MDSFVELTGTGLRYCGYAALPWFGLPLLCLIFPNRLRHIGQSVSARLDQLSNIVFRLAGLAAFAIILIQLIAVVLRYVFGLSFSWLNDSVIFSFAMIFMLGAAGTLQADGHVRVDILRSRFSPRLKAGIELFGAMAFIMPVCVLILYAGSGMIARSWIGLEPFNESDGLPVKFLFKTLVPAFALLMMGQGLSQALKAARTLRPPVSGGSSDGN